MHNWEKRNNWNRKTKQNLKNISKSYLDSNSEQTLQKRCHILWAIRFTEIKMNLPISVNKWQVWFPLIAQTLLPCYVNICLFPSAIGQRYWKHDYYWKNDYKMNEGKAQVVTSYAGMVQPGQLSQENCRTNNSVKCDPSQKEFLSSKSAISHFPYVSLSLTCIFLLLLFSCILVDFCNLLKTMLLKTMVL